MTTSAAFAAGSAIEIRDEEWIVSSCERAGDGWKVHCVGSSELVRSTPATFYSTLDEIEALDPAEAELVQDDSPHFRRSRLWVEAVLRTEGHCLDRHPEVGAVPGAPGEASLGRRRGR